MSTLVDLLDVTNLNDESQVTSHFAEIASCLLLQHCLYVVHRGSVFEYQLLEVEFYLNNHSFHCDPFCHSTLEQRTSGQWYFHKVPRRNSAANVSSKEPFGGYRGGTRKGLDLTFGLPVLSPHFETAAPGVITGGILLRSVRRLSDNKVISGPSLLVDEILRISGAPDIKSLVVQTWKTQLTALMPPKNPTSSCMYLAPPTNAQKLFSEVYTSPRVGLDLSKPSTTPSITDPRVVYIGKPYRFFTCPQCLTANGRIQTFVGLLCRIRKQVDEPSHVVSEVAKIGAFSLKTVEKYLSVYDDGTRHGSLAEFVGQGSRDTPRSSSGYLRMLGVLQGLDAQ